MTKESVNYSKVTVSHENVCFDKTKGNTTFFVDAVETHHSYPECIRDAYFHSAEFQEKFSNPFQESQVSSEGSYFLQFIWWSLSCLVLIYDIQDWSALNRYLKPVVRKKISAKFLTFLLVRRLLSKYTQVVYLWLHFLIYKKGWNLMSNIVSEICEINFVFTWWWIIRQLFNSFNLDGTKMELLCSWLF